MGIFVMLGVREGGGKDPSNLQEGGICRKFKKGVLEEGGKK